MNKLLQGSPPTHPMPEGFGGCVRSCKTVLLLQTFLYLLWNFSDIFSDTMTLFFIGNMMINIFNKSELSNETMWIPRNYEIKKVQF